MKKLDQSSIQKRGIISYNQSVLTSPPPILVPCTPFSPIQLLSQHLQTYTLAKKELYVPNPRAATSVATKIDPLLFLNSKK